MKDFGGMVSSQARWSGLLAQLQKCIVALFIAGVLASGAAAAPAPDVVAGVFNGVNDYRASQGKPPLQMNDKLNQSAQAYAELLAAAAPDSADQAQAGKLDPNCGGFPKVHCWDGTTPSQRAQNAGFLCHQLVFENEAASWGSPTLDHATAIRNAINGWIDD